jgi:preprotein translocase subunit YajC
VHGIEADLKSDVVPDDASSLTDADDADAGSGTVAAADDKAVDLGKTEDAPKKTDGESDAK